MSTEKVFHSNSTNNSSKKLIAFQKTKKHGNKISFKSVDPCDKQSYILFFSAVNDNVSIRADIFSLHAPPAMFQVWNLM